MFKFIQENKIKEVRDEDTFNRAFYVGEFVEDTEHTVEDYEQYDGEFVLKQDVPVEYQNEQIRQQRQSRFVQESDPLKLDYDEAVARGDEEKIEQTKQAWLDKKDQIRNDLPYVTESDLIEDTSDNEETISDTKIEEELNTEE